jgi:hypothetical protein
MILKTLRQHSYIVCCEFAEAIQREAHAINPGQDSA